MENNMSSPGGINISPILDFSKFVKMIPTIRDIRIYWVMHTELHQIRYFNAAMTACFSAAVFFATTALGFVTALVAQREPTIIIQILGFPGTITLGIISIILVGFGFLSRKKRNSIIDEIEKSSRGFGEKENRK